MISTRVSVAVHILSLLEVNKSGTNTSEYLASSVNTNPVVIRRITGMLNKAGLVDVRPGIAGAKLAKSLKDITLLDVYKAVQAVEENGLFAMHDKPNPACPVGRNIQSSLEPAFSAAQQAMENKLEQIVLADLVENMAEEPGQEKMDCL
ncbi:transcriptional regulator [Paenibacillus sp. CAA11]|uniref:Rrf2 family transcriptional regulator n=1 Tax=Paenibacillus sp. CAA11 TaxID=1532905 RepID=UPI000D37EABE|nr:Rrf2 family transcriptional regulator [Paenibacillus sp. CAA11]AWB44529.1 transcriptional regulator [Paenibacillus sp. CAA11]